MNLPALICKRRAVASAGRNDACRERRYRLATPAIVSTTADLIHCPWCGGVCHSDHNSFWCDKCRGLWPKGSSMAWEKEWDAKRQAPEKDDI